MDQQGAQDEVGGAGRDALESFTIVRPTTAGRFVFASPHSGRFYPSDLGADPTLPEASLRSAEDALVDRLIASGPALGAVLVLARVGRAYIDLNRAAEELDPALIDGVAGAVTARSAAGYGVVPRLTGDGRPLYTRRLARQEVQDRLDKVHAPYHAALAAELGAARARCGEAVLVDWHSMPARATGGSRGVRGPDVVLGDRHGASCGPDLTRRLRRSFEALGWRVALNRPYAGGWTTQLWGRPDEGCQAIQIELNRALYWDEAAQRPGVGWKRAQKGIERVIADLLRPEV